MGKQVKVVRIPLKFKTSYKDDTPVLYKDMCNLLWDLQYETRKFKNKATQIAWEHNNLREDFKEKNGAYPQNDNEIFGTCLHTYIRHKFSGTYKMSSKMFDATIKSALDNFRDHRSDFLKGLSSIDSYKSNQPLEIATPTIKIDYIDNKFIFRIGMLNKEFAKENNLPTQLAFESCIPPKAKSQITILERCYDKVYNTKNGKLFYDKKNKEWVLNLTYEFEKRHLQLDSNKILGIDLGDVVPLAASIYGEKDRLMLSGKKLKYLRQRTEKRRKSALEASVVCGDGSIGHGYHTRTKAVERIGDKIARFRNTVNHSFSRELINYAVKKGCGTIQMEDLTGVTKKANSFLKNWSYFDLQTKIEYKAKEQGINVVYIQPYYTSKRCSKCGFIHDDNRVTQANFKCLNCGYTENADYNASQNIAIKDIDKIINESMKQI